MRWQWRRPQLTLRVLLAVTAIAALCCGGARWWWIIREKREEAARFLETHGAIVEYGRLEGAWHVLTKATLPHEDQVVRVRFRPDWNLFSRKFPISSGDNWAERPKRIAEGLLVIRTKSPCVTGARSFSRSLLPLLEQLPFVQELDMSYCDVTDADIAGFAHLQGVTHLVLSSTLVNDESLLVIGELRSLESLMLTDTSITGRTLGELARCPRLRVLGLGGTQVEEQYLVHLTNLRELRDLRIHNTALSTKGVASLVGSDALTMLDLSRTRVDDDGVAQLVSLRRLRRLCLDGTCVSDRCMPYLARMESLRTLSLQDTTVSESGVAAFSEKRPMVDVIYSRLPNSKIRRRLDSLLHTGLGPGIPGGLGDSGPGVNSGPGVDPGSTPDIGQTDSKAN